MLSFRLVPWSSRKTFLVAPAAGREVRMRTIRFFLQCLAGPLSIGLPLALLPFCLVVLFCLVRAAAAQPVEPRVTAFSPHGTVKSARQVQAVFSAPMVPFGDIRLADPFDVVCSEAGVGRWVD